MKQYIRLKNNKVIDTTKRSVYEVNYSKPAYVIGRIEFYKDDIVIESNNVLDLIQVGDLVGEPVQLINRSQLDLIQDRKENYNVKIPEELSISKIYTKQGDNYVLVWDKKRGVI